MKMVDGPQLAFVSIARRTKRDLATPEQRNIKTFVCGVGNGGLDRADVEE